MNLAKAERQREAALFSDSIARSRIYTCILQTKIADLMLEHCDMNVLMIRN